MVVALALSRCTALDYCRPRQPRIFPIVCSTANRVGGTTGPSGGGDGPRRPRGRPRKVPPKEGDVGAGPSKSTDDVTGPHHSGEGVAPCHMPGPWAADVDRAPGGQPAKRRRGRPRKSPEGGPAGTAASQTSGGSPKPVRRRGRPPKFTDMHLSRTLALRSVFLRQMRLRLTAMRAPPSSWRKLLLGLTVDALAKRVSELIPLLGFVTVRSIATRHPHIFLMTPTHIMDKLRDINIRLPLTRQRLLATVSRFPGLLGCSAATIGGRVTLLVQELNKREDFVVQMLVSQPTLLGLAPANLRHRIGLVHEAASLLPNQWSLELEAMKPSTLSRLLRCSDTVLQRLIFTYLRTANNGRKFHKIRKMTTICFMSAAAWKDENPLFAKWLDEGEAKRRDGLTRPWPGWFRQVGDVDWWQDRSPGTRAPRVQDIEEPDGPPRGPGETDG